MAFEIFDLFIPSDILFTYIHSFTNSLDIYVNFVVLVYFFPLSVLWCYHSVYMLGSGVRGHAGSHTVY